MHVYLVQSMLGKPDDRDVLPSITEQGELPIAPALAQSMARLLSQMRHLPLAPAVVSRTRRRRRFRASCTRPWPRSAAAALMLPSRPPRCPEKKLSSTHMGRGGHKLAAVAYRPAVHCSRASAKLGACTSTMNRDFAAAVARVIWAFATDNGAHFSRLDRRQLASSRCCLKMHNPNDTRDPSASTLLHPGR